VYTYIYVYNCIRNKYAGVAMPVMRRFVQTGIMYVLYEEWAAVEISEID